MRWHGIAGLAAALWAAGGWAMSTGPLRGNALLGRPLALEIPVTPERDEAVDCVEAQVLYGDTPVQPNRTVVQVLHGGSQVLVQVRTTLPVNEPFVSVQLRLGCSGRLTRQFVLLADRPDPREPSVALPGTANPPLPAPAPAARPAAAAPATAASRAAAPANPAGPRAAPTPRAAASAATAERPKRAAPARPRPSERLRIDLVDLPVPDPTLRLSGTLATGEGTPAQRSAAAALWKALGASPEDAMRREERVAQLERELRDVRAASTQKDRQATQLQARLAEAEAQRYRNPLVYVLAIALLAALALAAWAWRRAVRARLQQRWWQAADAEPAAAPFTPERTTPVVPIPAPDAPASAPGPIDLDLGFPQEPFEEDAPPREAAVSDWSAGQGPASQVSLRAVELHDAQQEAEFFMSIGEHDQAVAVLRNHIRQQPETSALAWLDLLEIHHRLGQRGEFDGVRRDIQRYFNARVPEFGAYREDEGPGLEDHPNAIGRITALWPSPRVLDVIEESLFRRQSTDGRPAFSVQAYRDLLMLHHIGTELLHTGGHDWDAPAPAGSEFSSTNIHPLSADTPLPSLEAATATAPPLEPSSLDLDLDLGGFGDSQGAPGARMPPADEGNLLDFDLPEIDPGQYRTRKTRE